METAQKPVAADRSRSASEEYRIGLAFSNKQNWKTAARHFGQADRQSSARDHRQRDVRWVISAVIDGLCRDGDLVTDSEWIARVEVAREAREVGARDLDANPMSGLDDIARRPEVDLILINLTRLDGCRLRIRCAETRA